MNLHSGDSLVTLYDLSSLPVELANSCHVYKSHRSAQELRHIVVVRTTVLPLALPELHAEFQMGTLAARRLWFDRHREPCMTLFVSATRVHSTARISILLRR
jgi:hypothetical protein